jgi:hypothetical protein
MLGIFRLEAYNSRLRLITPEFFSKTNKGHEMKKILAAALIAGILTVLPAAGADGAIRRTIVPRVAYLEPANDAVIDLAGKKTLTFSWKQQPIPSGGRMGFRFRLYKGFDYELIVKEELSGDVLSIDVPADKFEDGATYSWHVEQRDSANMLWSLHDRWSFKVANKR